MGFRGWLTVAVLACLVSLAPTFPPEPETGDEWYVRHGFDRQPPPQAEPWPRLLSPAPVTVTPAGDSFVYLPLVARDYRSEFRALWVTRYDWTRADGTWAQPSALEAIAEQAAAANFNVLLFQVRGIDDAYYTPGYEPWASRLTGTVTRTLGTDPGFDPLATLIGAAHARRLQVHAYLNVYPTWLCGVGAPPHPVTPTHPFWTFSRQNGVSWSAWRVYDSSGTPMNMMTCSSYLWATPAWEGMRSHFLGVVTDLVTRYELDGVHLDLVRYPGRNYSYDPFTPPTFPSDEARAEWQRGQVNRLVQETYQVVKTNRPNAWVTAAVWGVYQNQWGFSQGYSDYYQDSKRWLRQGWVDGIMPMIYPANPSENCPDTTVWALERFRTLVADFVADAGSRYVFPGIHGGYACFDDVINRIQASRELGAKGHAIFSHGTVNSKGYWDELALQAYPSWVPVPPIPHSMPTEGR